MAWPVFAGYVAVFVAQLGAGILIAVAFVIRWMVTHPEALRLSKSALNRELIAQTHTFFAIFWVRLSLHAFGSLYFFAAAAVGISIFKESADGGLRTRVSTLPGPGMTAAIVGAYSVSQVMAALLYMTGLSLPRTTVWLEQVMPNSTAGHLAATLLVLAVLPGFSEELFFRGYMQTRLSRCWGRWPAIIATSAAFGLVHMGWFLGIHAFVIGVYLGWIVERTGSVRPAIAAHIFTNAVGIALVSIDGRSEHVNAMTLVCGACALVSASAAVAILRMSPCSAQQRT